MTSHFENEKTKEKIRQLTASWIDATNHTTDDVEGQFVSFGGGSTVTLDGYFTEAQLRKVVQVLEILKKGEK